MTLGADRSGDHLPIDRASLLVVQRLGLRTRGSALHRIEGYHPEIDTVSGMYT